MKRKSNENREGYGSKSGVGTGVSFGTESNRKNSMKKHKETREVIGTGAGICGIVCIGMGKGMSSG